MHFTEENVLKGIADQKPYIYFHDKELNLSFPVDRFSEQIKLIATRVEPGAIGVIGKTYFNSIEIIKTSEQTDFKLGKSISGTLYSDGISYKLELKGVLEERITTLEFILALANGVPLEINGVKVAISLSQQLINQKITLENALKLYKVVRELLKKSYITKQLNIDNITKGEVRDLECLCRSELYNEEVPIRNEDARIGFAKISNVNFLCYSSPIGNGLYHVYNFFRNDVLRFTLGDNNNQVKVSKYLILCELNTNAIAKVDNISYKELVKELEKDKLSDIEYDYYCKLLLQLISVFDNT